MLVSNKLGSSYKLTRRFTNKMRFAIFSYGFNSKWELLCFLRVGIALFTLVFPNDCLDLYGVDASGKFKHSVEFSTCHPSSFFSIVCLCSVFFFCKH